MTLIYYYRECAINTENKKYNNKNKIVRLIFIKVYMK